MQNIEEAQDLNRRLHRRVQRMEAPYDAKIGSAQEDTARALRQVSKAHEDNRRLIEFVRSTQEGRERDFSGLESLFYVASWFFAWAIVATLAAIYFYNH